MDAKKTGDEPMADNTAPGTAATAPGLTGVIFAATIGNMLEWFDFLVYGFFASTLAEVFFPTGNPTVSLLITFGAFGLSYVARPIGAAVIGTYTDRAGRKAGLTLSIALMMIGTTMMVVTPGYASIGIAAPVIITMARLLQGFSVGGEFGSAVWSTPAIAAATPRAGSGPAPASSRSLSRFSASP
jgi:MFS transporter, MHS family, proline/betaine transporter